MNRDDIVDILTAIAITDRRTVSDNEVTMWQKIVGDLPKNLCLEAIVDHFRERPGVWLEPGHLHARVKAMVAERYQRSDVGSDLRLSYEEACDAKAGFPVSGVDDGVSSVAELEAADDAMDKRMAPRLAEAIGTFDVPAWDEQPKYTRPSRDPSHPLNRPCSWCGAVRGERCMRMPERRVSLRRGFHPARVENTGNTPKSVIRPAQPPPSTEPMCSRCQKIPRLGSDARRGENPMWCWNCCAEAAGQKLWESRLKDPGLKK